MCESMDMYLILHIYMYVCKYMCMCICIHVYMHNFLFNLHLRKLMTDFHTTSILYFKRLEFCSAFLALYLQLKITKVTKTHFSKQKVTYFPFTTS